MLLRNAAVNISSSTLLSASRHLARTAIVFRRGQTCRLAVECWYWCTLVILSSETVVLEILADILASKALDAEVDRNHYRLHNTQKHAESVACGLQQVGLHPLGVLVRIFAGVLITSRRF